MERYGRKEDRVAGGVREFSEDHHHRHGHPHGHPVAADDHGRGFLPLDQGVLARRRSRSRRRSENEKDADADESDTNNHSRLLLLGDVSPDLTGGLDETVARVRDCFHYITAQLQLQSQSYDQSHDQSQSQDQKDAQSPQQFLPPTLDPEEVSELQEMLASSSTLDQDQDQDQEQHV